MNDKLIEQLQGINTNLNALCVLIEAQLRLSIREYNNPTHQGARVSILTLLNEIRALQEKPLDKQQ